MEPAMLSVMDSKRIVSVLDAADDLTIATVRADGYPQATTVSFVNEGLKIYFGTGAQAQKAKNIALNDKVSVTVNLPYSKWDEIKGVSLAGHARRVITPDEFRRVGELMLSKFPQISQYASFSKGMELTLFRIDAEIVSLLDYAQGFGHTEFFDLREQ
jgi:hypothetical protein